MPIRPGRCPQLTNCDDYKLGKILPDGGEFTSTFIYGSWNGKITFYEPMVNLNQFNGLRNGEIEDACFDIKAPQAWQRSGWYLTKYCLRHRDNRDETLTTLADFVYRKAS